MSPYSGLQLYPPHQPQLHRDEHSMNMDNLTCKSRLLFRSECITKGTKLIFFFVFLTAWGPSDPNFKLADDTSDRGE